MDTTTTQTDTLISPYGGELVNRLLSSEERQALLEAFRCPDGQREGAPRSDERLS